MAPSEARVVQRGDKAKDKNGQDDLEEESVAINTGEDEL